MKLLLDTHVLLWAATRPAKLSARTTALLLNVSNELFFSAASLWEVAIKRANGRQALLVEAGVLRRRLLTHQYKELVINGGHAVFVEKLPLLHRDPFDRILIAQAAVDGLVLVSADKLVLQYPGQLYPA